MTRTIIKVKGGNMEDIFDESEESEDEEDEEIEDWDVDIDED